MSTIFYLMSIVLIFIEINWIISPIEKTDQSRRFLELSKQHKGINFDFYSDEYKSLLYNKAWGLFVYVWVIVGLLTSQWILFLSFLLLNILIVGPISKLVRFSFIYTLLHWINSLIGFAFGLFVVVNHFHLKIDTYKLFIQLFS